MTGQIRQVAAAQVEGVSGGRRVADGAGDVDGAQAEPTPPTAERTTQQLPSAEVREAAGITA
ncbi:hypothetical protein [Streptomyces sp. NPDC050548]|uniref:hypothetical protein n=1 Tax=Streptomyces sp. NPDC050548 TaxID=3365629 RepID=UPI003792732C